MCIKGLEVSLCGPVCGKHLCGHECDGKSPLRGPGTLVWTQLRVKGVAQKLHFLTVTGDWELEAHETTKRSHVGTDCESSLRAPP